MEVFVAVFVVIVIMVMVMTVICHYILVMYLMNKVLLFIQGMLCFVREGRWLMLSWGWSMGN